MRWITKEQATHLLCNGKVLWSFGGDGFEMRGGYNRTGAQSVIHLDPIMAVEGHVKNQQISIPLTNRYLFRRDKMCMYCGQTGPITMMTRDHIHPKSRGGKDVWENVVQACRICNQRKRDRTPEEADMPLLAVPFKPTINELLYLQNHYILQDQLKFLEKGFKHLRLDFAA